MSTGDDRTRRRERPRVPEMRRRIAATASAAAIAVGGGVGAASAPGSPVRTEPQTRIAGSERTNGAQDMAAIARREQDEHRRHLARALADQLPGAEAERVDAALASTDRLLTSGAGSIPVPSSPGESASARTRSETPSRRCRGGRWSGGRTARFAA